MGAGCCTIRFEKELPRFIQIQTLFSERTGLNLSLKAELQLQTLCSSNYEIFTLLEKDASAVDKIEKARKEFYDSHPQQYELMAQYRDKITKQLNQLNHIINVQFAVLGFYEIDFSVKDREIKLFTWIGQEYALNNLIKVLIDLGGKFYDGDQEKENRYPEKWKNYKKWHEYKWYNRPRK